MAKTLSLRLTAALKWSYRNLLDLNDALDAKTLQILDTLASGTGLDQADRLFADTRSLTAAANDDLDLAASLTDVFGATLTFVKIKAILIHNKSTTAGDIIHVGGGSNNFVNWIGAAGDIVKIGPNGVLLLWNPSAAGYAVTAGTGDILRITEAGGVNGYDYDIVLAGTSA